MRGMQSDMVLNFSSLVVSAVTWLMPACQSIFSVAYHLFMLAIRDDFPGLTNVSVLSFLGESDQPCLQWGTSLMSSYDTTSCFTQLHVQHGLFSR